MNYETNRYYRAAEFAAVAELTPTWVEKLCANDRLKAKKIRGRWHVAGSEFAAYMVDPDEKATVRRRRRHAPGKSPYQRAKAAV